MEDAGEVLRAADDPDLPLFELLGTARRAGVKASQPPSDWALDRVRAVMRDRGWATTADNPGIRQAARALDELATTGTTSHFTFASPLHTTLCMIMAVGTTAIWLATLVGVIALLGTDHDESSGVLRSSGAGCPQSNVAAGSFVA